MRKSKQGFRSPDLKGLPASLGAAAVLCLVTIAIEGGLPLSEPETFWRVLCDGLTVPGVLLTGSGLLRVVSGAGAFDGVRFGVRKAVDQLRREEKRELTPKTYYDYVEARGEKPRRSPGMLLTVGILCRAGAGITLAVYLSL